MKSTMTLTDEVNVSAVECLRGVSDALNVLITKAGDFAITGEVEFLKAELITEPDKYKCNHQAFATHDDRCEQKKEPGRTYAKLVLKVSSQD